MNYLKRKSLVSNERYWCTDHHAIRTLGRCGCGSPTVLTAAMLNLAAALPSQPCLHHVGGVRSTHSAPHLTSTTNRIVEMRTANRNQVAVCMHACFCRHNGRTIDLKITYLIKTSRMTSSCVI